jgi:type IV pilus assembly protein PilE
VACGNETARTYTITATGTDSMTGFVYTVNQAGLKQTTGVKTGWKFTQTDNCWVIRKDGSCG